MREPYKVEALGEVKHCRLLPLLILPRLHPETKALELLFKKHPKWIAVLPSFEIHTLPRDAKAVTAQVEKEAHKVFTFGSVSGVLPAGGLLTFKRSPTHREENLYCFPLYIVRGTVSDEDLSRYSEVGWELEYIPKAAIETDARLGKSANADVFRAIERIHSGWRSIAAYAYEYDLFLSFAGAQRALVKALLTQIRKLDRNIRVFYDQEQNLLGRDMGRLFSSVGSRRSRFFVPVISRDYKKNVWPRHELRAALTRAISARGYEFILPLRYDDTLLEDLPETLAYEALSASNLPHVAKQIVQRLRGVHAR